MYEYDDYGYVCYSCGAGFMRRGQYNYTGMIAMHGCRECGGDEPKEPAMSSFDHMEDDDQT